MREPNPVHLWQYALQKLVETKSPTKIIVYEGKCDSIPKLDIPVIYYTDYITKNFRK